jgi:hypothetical protein
MNNRKLQFEPLERRELLAGVWPQNLGTHGILIDGGKSLTHLVPPAVKALGMPYEAILSSYTSKTRAVGGSPADTNGPLEYPDGQDRFWGLYMNGGYSNAHMRALGPAGREAIVDFVMDGGSYGGTCAGMFAVKDSPSYFLGLWAGSFGNYGGHGYQTVTFTPEDGEFYDYVQRFVGSDTVSSIPFLGGPTLTEAKRHPEGTNFVGDITKSPFRRNRGTSMFLEYYPSESAGLLFTSTSHFEYAKSGPRLDLGKAYFTYLADHSKVEPKVIGDLTAGTTTAVVGDGQYHRWSMDVPPGLAEFTITTSLPADTEVFLTFDGVAYQGGSDFSGDTITVTAPTAGKWEASVLGTHSVANGKTYSLTLEAVRDEPIVWEATPEAELPAATDLAQQSEPSQEPTVLPAAPIQQTATAAEIARRSVFAEWTPFDDYLELAT